MGQIAENLTKGQRPGESQAMIDPDNALRVAKEAALAGREVLLRYYGKLRNVQEKAQEGLVSEADREAENQIRSILTSEFSDLAFVGEESSFHDGHIDLGPTDRKRGVWFVDPLDGTTNYVHQMPIFCVSIGLEVNHELLVGVVDVPALQRTYTAIKGKGAYVNGVRLNASKRNSLGQSLLATGFSSNDSNTLREQLEIFRDLVGKARGVRRAGSAAYDLCLVAEGVYDAYWEKQLKPWDMAAGALLVTEAGGLVTDYAGKKFDIFDRSIVAGSSFLHKLVLETIRSCSVK